MQSLLFDGPFAKRSMMRLNRAGRVSLAAVGGLALALLAAACSSSNAATLPPPPGLEKTQITVGALPVVDSVGLYLAIKNGYFKQEGLTVTAVPIAKSPDAIPEMVQGKVDIVSGANYVSFFQAQLASAGKLNFKVLVDGISCNADTFDVLALPGSGINSPAQLAGKTIGVNLKNNIQTLLTDTALRAANVNPATVRYKQVPFPQMADALKAHRVDAISAVEPFITGAELSVGAQTILSDCTGPTANFPISGYFATQAWTQKYPNTARAFQTALNRGQALADSSRAEVEQALTGYIKGLSSQEAAIVNLGQFPTSLDGTHLQRVASLMATGGLIGQQFSVEPLLFH
jgi:NitT/TauT family transport system substrate-binding protein